MTKEEFRNLNIDNTIFNLFKVIPEDKPIIMDHVAEELSKFCAYEDNLFVLMVLVQDAINRAEKHNIIEGKPIDDQLLEQYTPMTAGFMFGYLYRMKEMHSL